MDAILSGDPIAEPDAAQRFHIGFAGSLGRGCLGDVLLRLPDLEPAFSCGSGRALLAAVRAGTLDAVVLAGPVAPDLAAVHLCDEHVRLVTAPGHPLADPEPLDPSRLDGIDLLLAREDDGGDMRRRAGRLLGGRARVTEVPMRELAGHVMAGVAAALACQGRAEQLPPGLIRRPILSPEAVVPLYLCCRPGDPGPALARLIAAVAS